MNIKDKKIVVAGLGTTGFETALFLSKKGVDVYLTESKITEDISKNISILQSKNIKTEVGGHTEKFVSDMDILV
ncbi:MAG: hypothetical protein GX554_05715, partial [Elusimicrobia bacterium]|nr:hypothetical protein [Elusimicrobiota bacterium]